MLHHVNFPTHRGRNTLEAIITDSHSKILTVKMIQVPYISNCCVIQSAIKIDTKIQKLLLKIKDVNMDAFVNNMGLGTSSIP